MPGKARHDERENKKRCQWQRFLKESATAKLLDFCFAEFNVLADFRVVFADNHLFRHVAGVFLSDVEIACLSRADKANFDHGGFGHSEYSENMWRAHVKKELGAPLRIQTVKSR
jgi:hypothetical protein